MEVMIEHGQLFRKQFELLLFLLVAAYNDF